MHHFGVPYVLAPYEAESQCAYLQSNGDLFLEQYIVVD